MMDRAGRHYAVLGLAFAALLAVVGWGGYEGYGRFKAEALRDQLLRADTQNVPGIVEEMSPYRRWTDRLLQEAYQQAGPGSRARLHASMALLPVDAGQTTYLYTHLLDATPQEVPVLCEILAVHQDDLREKLWAVAEQPAPGKEQQRLRAACALAKYDPGNERWEAVAGPVVEDFVAVPPAYLERWMASLKPVSGKLQPALEAVFRDARRTETRRVLATSILADYLADQPLALARLLLDADEGQFPLLFERVREHADVAQAFLQGEIGKRLADAVTETARERLAKHQANAAVALLRLNRPAGVWPLLERREDPRVRSYLVHRLGPLGIEARTILDRLHEEANVTSRRALLLSLGEVKPERWLPGEREAFVAELQDLYRTAPDPGLHASAAWLLRQWGQGEWLYRVDQEWALDAAQRQKQVRAAVASLAKAKGQASPRWYVTSQGQTMVVMAAPAEFMMGWRGSQHRQRISRPFALSATPVTDGQYRLRGLPGAKTANALRDHPEVYKSWYEAAAYCNWLSEREGIDPDQWCYETDAAGQMKLRKGYLSRTGYRLPTEAEMEYANRAGATTNRFYGESVGLLEKYGWFVPNAKVQLWPVGKLKPNDLGFFDTHGNVWCWCQETQRTYPPGEPGRVFEDEEGALEINPNLGRAMRGNCYTDQGNAVGCASCWYPVPTYQSNIAGFRVARTMPAE
jgi:formylglycine-generating enzyme required for sulfatase activity